MGRPILFNAIVQVCKEENKTYLLTPYLSKIRVILPWAKMTLEQKIVTYTNIIQIVKQRNDSSLLYEQLRQLFDEFEGAPQDQIKANKDLLATSIIDVIQNDEHLFELGEICELDQIKTLLSDLPNLQKLTKAIITGDVSAGDDLFQQNQALLATSGIDDKEDLKNKIRYSSISTIGDQYKSMSFADLAVKLQCPEDEIETLFITAIEFGYLDALIDESQQIVYFRYFPVLTFF